MTNFSRLRDELGDTVEDQLVHLRKEVEHLRKSLARQGARGYSVGHDQVSELYGEAQERLAELVPHMRRGARVAGRAVRDNPAPIIIGGIVVGLLAALAMSRR